MEKNPSICSSSTYESLKGNVIIAQVWRTNLLYYLHIVHGLINNDVDSGELGDLLNIGTLRSKNNIKAIGALSLKKKKMNIP